MFNKEIKNLFFKVKKTQIENRVIQGFIVPIVNEKWVGCPYEFDERHVEFIALNGLKHKMIFDSKNLSNTRICNENVSKAVQSLIKYYKDLYEKQKECVDLYKKAYSLKDKINDIKSNQTNTKIIEKINKLNGLISIRQLTNDIKSQEIRVKHSEINQSIEVNYSTDVITGLTISQNYASSDYRGGNHFNFVFQEYDRTLHVDDELLQTSKSGKKLRLQNFYTLKKNFSIKNCSITESYSGDMGDKDYLHLSNDIYISFKKPLLRNEESLKYLKELIRTIDKNLN